MSYKFEDEKVIKPLSTENLLHLKSCEMRLRGVQASVATPEKIAESSHWTAQDVLTQERADIELGRLNAARDEIYGRLSEDEREEYAQHLKDTAPRELSKEEVEARMKQMNLNKDKPSH